MANPPVSIGRYQVVRPIGQGGMGSLYLVWDPKLERQIAIKLLKDDDDELRERFSREARAAARLRHPHIVTIFDVGDHDGQPFIAMEFVQGETLGDVIRQRQPLPVSRKLELIEELCDGLGFAHKAGIVHRDIKPANIMVDLEGSLKILDFGIARAAESVGMTQAGMLIGTLNYMSPEQVSGLTVDQRSDIFAVGSVCYELLAYRQAFPGSLLGGILNKILNEPPDPLSELVRGINPEIVRIVERAIAKDPKDRYQDLASMRKDLQMLRFRMQTGDLPTQVHETPLAGAAHAVSQTPAATPAKPTPTPRRTADREELARRKAGQIQASLDEANAAMAAEEFDAAIAACEQILMLDSDNARALELLDRARAAQDDRQIREWLATAQHELDRGALTSARGFVSRAEAINPSAPGVRALHERLEQALVRRVQAQERADTIARLVAQGQASFEAGAFEEAERNAEEALALDPDDAEARGLKSRATMAREALERDALLRRVHDTTAEAQRLFQAGEHQQAIDLLAAFQPRHESIARTLEELRGEAARIAAERQREADLRAKAQRIAAAIALAKDDLGRSEFGRAIERLRALERAEGGTAEIRAAIADAESARTSAERAAAVDNELRRAADLQARGDLKSAVARVDAALALSPGHEKARALKAALVETIRVETERQKAEERAARERQQEIAALLKKARKASSPQAAIEALREVLTIEPEHADARRLIAEREMALEAEQQQRERDLERERERQRQRDAAARDVAVPPADDRTVLLSSRHVTGPAAEPADDTTLLQARTAPTARVAQSEATIPVPPVRVPTSRPDLPTRPVAPPDNRKMYLAAAVVGFLVLLVGGYFIFGGGPSTPDPAQQTGSATPQPTSVAPPEQTTNVPTPTAVQTPASQTAQTTPTPAPTQTPIGARGQTPDARLIEWLADAQRKLAGGAQAGARASTMEAWRINRQHPRVNDMLTQLKQEARAVAMRAKGRADNAGQAATSSRAYQEGKSELESPERGSPTEIIDRYRRAEDLFQQAEAEAARPKPAESKPAETRTIPTTPVPTPTATQPPPTSSPVASATGAAGGTPVPPPPPPVNEDARIRAALQQFERAWAAKDVDAVVAVSVFHQPQVAALRQSFRNAKTQSSEIKVNRISTSGNTASVEAVRTVHYEPNGAKANPPMVSNVTIRMEKRNDRWVIVGIQ
jgi:tetratricopeptide (TPR) repeat protein/predicted Ser/Thr protein kinase